MADQPIADREPPHVEQRLEQALFAARWLVVPFYALLLFTLVLLFAAFVREFVYYVPKLFVLDSNDAILAVLTLIDLTLVANLVVIVVLASYETMVSRIDTTEERPSWMGSMGISDVKMKLFTSIVAISGIQLLKLFMAIGTPNAPSADTLFWLTTVHVVFVVTTVFSALADWISSRARSAKG